jgi:hypothetical protein
MFPLPDPDAGTVHQGESLAQYQFVFEVTEKLASPGVKLTIWLVGVTANVGTLDVSSPSFWQLVPMAKTVRSIITTDTNLINPFIINILGYSLIDLFNFLILFKVTKSY